MHTFETKRGTVFNFNADFSGSVRIKNENGSLEVSGEDLVDLIAFYYVQPKLISRIESVEEADEIFRIASAKTGFVP